MENSIDANEFFEQRRSAVDILLLPTLQLTQHGRGDDTLDHSRFQFAEEVQRKPTGVQPMEILIPTMRRKMLEAVTQFLRSGCPERS